MVKKQKREIDMETRLFMAGCFVLIAIQNYLIYEKINERCAVCQKKIKSNKKN